MSLPPSTVLPPLVERDAAAGLLPATRGPGAAGAPRATAANDATAPEKAKAEGVHGSIHIDGVRVQFEVDPEVDELVVKVVDPASGELIRQMPSEEAIRVATVLGRLQGLLVHRTA